MTTNPVIRIDEASQADPDTFETVLSFLRGYNHQFHADDRQAPLVLYARDADARVQGGLRGRTVWGWTFVEILAVADNARRQGIGRQLLMKAEQIARERGSVGLHLTTVAFQAPNFYKKLGYAQFGQLRDFPPGFTHHFFAKRFDGNPL